MNLKQFEQTMKTPLSYCLKNQLYNLFFLKKHSLYKHSQDQTTLYYFIKFAKSYTFKQTVT